MRLLKEVFVRSRLVREFFRDSRMMLISTRCNAYFVTWQNLQMVISQYFISVKYPTPCKIYNLAAELRLEVPLPRVAA